MQLWTAFLQTGWVGKSVLAILLFFSLTSWAVMFIIARRFRRSAAASQRFTAAFRRAKRLMDVQAATAATAYSSASTGGFEAERPPTF